MMNCEYLVYTADGSELSHEDLSKAFKLLTTVPYPYNTNPDNAEILLQLTSLQRELLNSKESVVILELLQQINPLINISYFPKSMLQFYLFSGLEKISLSEQHELFIHELNKVEQDKLSQFEAETREYFGDVMSEEMIRNQVDNHYIWGALVSTIGQKNFFKECSAANANSEIKTLWIHINNALVKEFQKYGSERFNRDLLLHTVNSWTGKFCMEYTDKNRITESDPVPSLGYDDFMSEPENVDILRKFLTFEVNTIFDDRINHLYITYRGSNGGPYGDLNLIKREPNHTLSLSNGVCEGTVHDKGANSWYFSSLTRRRDKKYRTGFALMFDPTMYDRDTILIPPLNRISGTLASGEDFHVRTKAANNKRNRELLSSNAFLVSNQLSGDDQAYEVLLKQRKGTLTAYLNSKIDNSICAPWPEYIPRPAVPEKANSNVNTLIGVLPYAFLVLYCLYVGKKVCGGCSDKNAFTHKDKSTAQERRSLINAPRIDMKKQLPKLLNKNTGIF